MQDFPDLNNAVVDEKELNNLSYNPDDYPTLDEFIEGVLRGAQRPPVFINPKQLSVRGRVVADRMEKYLGNKDFNPSSALKEVLTSPANYFFYMNDKDNFEYKPAGHFELGTFTHLCFLEPENFDKVVVEPEASRASLEGCNILVQFWEKTIYSKYTYKGVAEKKINQAIKLTDEAGHDMKKLAGVKYYIECLKFVSGYTAIKEQDKLKIEIIKRNYFRYGNGIIPLIMRGAACEHSFYGVDEQTGLKVKVRPDAFNVAENIGFDTVISFKTTSAPDISKFIYDSAKYKYEVSEGFYQDVMSNITGRQFNTTVMIVLQTVAPFHIAVMFWSPEDLANGKYKARYALDTIKDANDKCLYPGFDALAQEGHYGVIQMSQPSWAQKILHPVDIDD